MKNIFTKGFFSKLILIIAIWAVVALLMVSGVMSRSMQSLMIKICYYTILTLSLDLIVGYLGDLSLGHAAFYLVGAYAGCAVAVYTNLPLLVKFVLALIVGGAAAALVGFLISKAIIKLRGDYLAIVTLAFGEFIRSFVKIIPGLGGTKGLMGIPSFDSRLEGFTLAYIVLILVILVIYNFTHSRHGRTITAIRDNAIASESVGINIKNNKVLVFTIASFMAGMAGVIFGFYKTTLNPSDFTYNLSIEVLVMVVLGGMGSIKGSIIASVIIVALPEVLRGAEDFRMLIYAVALIAMMMLNASPRFTAIKRSFGEKMNGLRAKFKLGGKAK
ncbi:MAG: branched-chain amino acid ABC transporter permease [Clostridiales bacterium]|nr:branched-chain amino acid ABC transporter permease [Clostridiales bacterium]